MSFQMFKKDEDEEDNFLSDISHSRQNSNRLKNPSKPHLQLTTHAKKNSNQVIPLSLVISQVEISNNNEEEEKFEREESHE